MPASHDSRTRTGLLALGIGGLAFQQLRKRKRRASLAGQVALITGGSRGLGLALAHELGAQGCRLALCARDAEELRQAAAELQRQGYTVFTQVCDVADPDAVAALIAAVESYAGPIDLLVTNAGEIQVGPVTDLAVADFQRQMDIDFWGTFYPIMAVLPGMRARRSGHIALIGSIGGKVATPHLLPYTTAKFAVTGLGEGLGAELPAEGIAVTLVIPGFMRTGSHIQARFTGTREQREGDFAWFATGASSLIAPPADKAARTIVNAIRRGEREVIFPWPFALVSALHGLAPATATRVLEVMDRVLPSHPAGPGDAVKTERGEPIEDRNESATLDLLTTLGQDAEERFDQR
jgi:short-subunit dehydrogenase